MNRSEKIFLALFGMALVALVVFWRGGAGTIVAEGTPSPTQDKTSDNPGSGPEYLVSNMRYAFAPPVLNVMPSKVANALGASANSVPDYWGLYQGNGWS